MDSLKEWIADATLVSHVAGDVLYDENDRSDRVWLIRSGEVEVVRRIMGGEVVLGTTRAGDFLGEMGVIEGRLRSATARAITDVDAEVIDREAFIRRVSEDQTLAYDLIKRLGERLHTTERQLAQLFELSRGESVEPLHPEVPRFAPVAGSWDQPIEEDDETLDPLNTRVLPRLSPVGPLLDRYFPTVGWVEISRSPFTVGRFGREGEPGPGFVVDMLINDREPFRLSRAHFSIVQQGDVYRVRDWSSTLGTEVNGISIGNQFPTDHVELELGRNTVVAGGADSPYIFHIDIDSD